jgi:phage baseplate assembly protein V
MALNTGGVSFKTGLVAEAKPGFARVRFPDLDDLVTDWLPVLVKKSLQDKECWTLDKGEQVACILDEYFESGCVLGAVYSDADVPPVSSPDTMCFKFFDGGHFEYDRGSGKLTIVTTGPVDVTAGGSVMVKAPSVTVDALETTFTGNVLVKGALSYLGGMSGAGGSGGASAKIKGGVEVEGPVHASGDITSDADVRAGDISVQHHRHMEQGDGAAVSPAIA